MLIQDQFGYFHNVPDERFGGRMSPGFGEMVYDGLGNPLGFPLLSLLPLAAQILPSLLAPSGSPSSHPAPAAPLPLPAVVPPVSVAPVVSPPPPQVIVIRESAPGSAGPLPSLPPAQM